MTGEKKSKKNNHQMKPNNMKEKIKAIRMICGMFTKGGKNTGIVLCKGTKGSLIHIRGNGIDISKNIALYMRIDENIRDILASSVLAHILASQSIPEVLNESGLADLRKILEKTIAEGGAR